MNKYTSALALGLGGPTALSGGLGAGLLGDLFGGTDMPDVPDYLKAALSTSNASRYNESSPYGTVQWKLRAGADPNNPQLGDYERITSLAPEQQALFDQGNQNAFGTGEAVSGQLSDLSGGMRSVADALYGKQTQYLDQTFGDQSSRLENQLQNQGLMPGSEAYDRAVRNLQQTQQGAYATASNNAVLGADQAQNSAVSRIAQLLASSKAGMPTSGNVGAGPDYLGAVNQLYTAQNNQANAKQASKDSTMSTLGSLAGTAATIAMFSDRRLKSEISQLGIAGNGLPVYEYTIFGQRERGHMADEVANAYPTAVSRHSSGYLMVDYSQIGGRP